MNNATTDLGTIYLRADAALLNAVDVKCAKTQVTVGIEKWVLNVSKNLTTIVDTAEALLRNLPSVTLNENGNPKT